MEYEESSSKDEVALANFCQALKTIQTRHTNVVQTMAQGVLELKDSHQVFMRKKKTSPKWFTVAMPLLVTSKKHEIDQSSTRDSWSYS